MQYLRLGECIKVHVDIGCAMLRLCMLDTHDFVKPSACDVAAAAGCDGLWCTTGW